MKSKKHLIILCAAFLFLGGCDNDFEEVNKNPYAIQSIDPALLFANAVRQSHPGNWEVEQTIVQQFVNAYNLGATAGPNFNEDTDNFNTPRWNNLYPNSIKLLVQAIDLAEEQPTKVNLMSMMRIWKAYLMMTLVDTYGHVPYFEAGRATAGIFTPKYDDDAAIYDDLYTEIKSAADAMDPAGDYVSADLFYKSFGTIANPSGQVAKWKKLSNSLLLRLGMRYSKVNSTLAQSRVAEAVTRGVMVDNTDNALLTWSSTYPNQLNQGPRTIASYYYYAAEPFVNHLKATNDPRAKYMIGKYTDPNSAPSSTPDVTLANQYGFPVGYDNATVQSKPDYRGTAPTGTGLNYSQINFNVVGSAIAPLFYVTNSQTKLLLAEATQKGWVTGQGTVQELYEAGVKANMDEWALYPNATAIPLTAQNTYLTELDVAFNATDALELIGIQYWLSSYTNGGESFANFRRTGFPVLSPNSYNNNLGGGFMRRLAYPNTEASNNQTSYDAAVAAFGTDNLTTRVFWDIP
jgi:hypothetical protein